METTLRFLKRYKEIVLIWIIIRSLLFIYPIIVHQTNLNPLNYWNPWDGPHYISIAKDWYQTVGDEANFIVFYPFYPLMIKIIALVTGDFLFSAITISLVSSLIASIILYELILLDYKKSSALLGVWFFNIYPTSYILQASYTESLYLSLSLLTFYFFRKQKSLNAGITGLLSSFTRINGLILLPALFFEASNIKKNISTLVLIPFGFFLYLIINYVVFGDFFYFQIPLSEHWYKRFEWPFGGIRYLFDTIPNFGSYSFYTHILEIASICLILFVGIFALFRLRLSYGIYTLLNLFLFISTSYIMSTPRYSLIIFPIYIVLAQIKNRTIIFLMSVIFTITLIYLTHKFTLGQWAF